MAVSASDTPATGDQHDRDEEQKRVAGPPDHEPVDSRKKPESRRLATAIIMPRRSVMVSRSIAS
jgi:hypothetical protein